MKQLVLALVASLGMVPASSIGALGDVSGTQVVLSCSDGHSVVLSADTATLTSLTADVASINASGTGLSCALDTPTVDPSTQSGDWTVYDYNPSGRGIRPRRSADSMPPTSSGGTASFQFIPGTYTALLVTTSSTYTGDLSQKTLTDTVTWSGTGAFFDHNNGNCAPDLQSVRFYFESPSAAGPSTGSPPAGFYTQFWWSNPDSVRLAGDPGGGQMVVTLTMPAALGHWSDWNGQENTVPAATEGFIEATHKVQMIGLSFGGCFGFENGVTTAAGGTFTSSFSEA